MANVTAGSILKSTAGYAVAVFANRALSFFLIPFYTRYLTPADYGVLELLDVTLNFTIVLAGSRFGQALFYFYFIETDEPVRQKHVSTSLMGSAALGAVAFFICWFLSAQLSMVVYGNGQYAGYFRLVAVGIGLAIPLETCLCCLRLFNEPAKYSAVAIVRNLVAGTLNVVLLGWFGMGVASMLYSAIVSQTLIVVFLSIYVLRRVPLRFDMQLFRKQVGYAAPLTVGSAGEFIMNYGDRYFLRQAVSLSEIGIYSLAYKIGMLIPLVQYPFTLYWSSQQVKIVHGEGGWRMFSRVGTYLALTLSAVAVCIVLFIDPLLQILVTPSFREAARYAPWVALAYFIRAIGYHFREVFVIRKRPDLEARVAWGGTMLCLAGYALLIPKFGLWGAIAATIASFLLVLFYAYQVSQRLWHVHYEYARFCKILACAIVVVSIFAIVKRESFWQQTVAGVALMALFGLLLHLSRFWHEDEKEYFRTKFKKLAA